MFAIRRGISAALVLCILIAGLSGCKKKEGPLERTGKEIDKAAEKAGQQIEKAAGKASEKLEKAGDAVKDAEKELKK